MGASGVRRSVTGGQQVPERAYSAISGSKNVDQVKPSFCATLYSPPLLPQTINIISKKYF
jgi:hypothetical protein